MNRIVRENYPVAALPEDLREGFPADGDVRVVIEPVVPILSEKTFSLQELFAKARPNFDNFEQVVAHIDAMREEWD